MTYWGYHLIFTLPWIVLLVFLLRHRIRPAHVYSWLAVCAIVFAFTTPWDNYAVFLGIWGFGEGVSLGFPLSNLARSADNPDGLTWLGLIPFEEYSFFLIEATLACLLTLFFLPRISCLSARSKRGQR